MASDHTERHVAGPANLLKDRWSGLPDWTLGSCTPALLTLALCPVFSSTKRCGGPVALQTLVQIQSHGPSNHPSGAVSGEKKNNDKQTL